MHDGTPSRRSFVVGAAGVALVGTFAVLAGREEAVPVATSDGITVVPPGTANPAPISRGTGGFGVVAGEPFRLVGEAGGASGSIVSVTPYARPSRRPAGVRAESFIVHLETDLAGAPAGDRIYSLAAPLAGLNDVFLTRGADVGGKAILMAVFG